MTEPRYCKNCGFVGVHKVAREISGGQWAMLICCFLLLIVPGIVYGLHLATGGGAELFWVCPKCQARLMSVPVDSPVAQAGLKQTGAA